MSHYLFWIMVLGAAAMLSGCATERDGRSLVCMGWCWAIEGHTVIETKREDKENGY